MKTVFINGSLWGSTTNAGATAAAVSGGETLQSHTGELDLVGWEGGGGEGVAVLDSSLHRRVVVLASRLAEGMKFLTSLLAG